SPSRLPVQVVDDQLETGPLHIGSHAAAHGAQPDESHHHVVVGHRFTVTPISDFRSASYRLAVRHILRKASLRKRRDARRPRWSRPPAFLLPPGATYPSDCTPT